MGTNKLYRYKRLPMGLSPAQGELNTALKPVFDHIPSAHLIHDNLVIATKDNERTRGSNIDDNTSYIARM